MSYYCDNNKLIFVDMKRITIIYVAILGCLCTAYSFNLVNPSFAQLTKSRRSSISMEYIPDGLTKEQWEKFKIEEAKRNEGKGLTIYN